MPTAPNYKPWDILRVAKSKFPMRPGEFRCAGGLLKVSLEHFEEKNTAVVSVGYGPNAFAVQPNTARVLAGFFNALADQLEGK